MMNVQTGSIGTYQSYIHLLTVLSFLVMLGLLAGCRAAITGTHTNQTSPEKAMEEFYSQKGPEDTWMDPLILAGDEVVPLVIREIKNKNMPRRRYAIAFLGNGSYREAIPTLHTIVNETGEEGYIRADALIAIYMTDETSGRGLAEAYKEDKTALGEIARRVLAADPELRKRRTREDALLGKHN